MAKKEKMALLKITVVRFAPQRGEVLVALPAEHVDEIRNEAREFIESLASAADLPAEAAAQPTDDGEDLGVLRGPVASLDSVIGDVIRAEVPPERKIEAFVQATACLELVLDEVEAEAAE